MTPPSFPYYYFFLCSFNYKIKSNKHYGTGIKTYVQMEDNWRTKPKYIWVQCSNIWQRCQQHTLEKRQKKWFLQQMKLEKLNFHMWSNYIMSRAINFHKTISQWSKDLNVTPKTLTILAENIGCNLLVIGIRKD